MFKSRLSTLYFNWFSSSLSVAFKWFSKRKLDPNMSDHFETPANKADMSHEREKGTSK